MIGKTKGELEAEISIAMAQFEKNHFGRGPKEAKAFIIEDMVLIRLRGVLTPAEQNLITDHDGPQLIKQIRMRLIESSRSLLETIIQDKTGAKIITLHSDISTHTGERILVFGLDENLEMKLNN